MHVHRDIRDVTRLYVCGTHIFYACTSRYTRRDSFIRMRDSYILCMHIEIYATCDSFTRVFIYLTRTSAPCHHSSVREQALKSTHIHTHTHAHATTHSPFRSLFSSVSRTHSRVFISLAPILVYSFRNTPLTSLLSHVHIKISAT